MGVKKNIQELKKIKASTRSEQHQKIDQIIELYKDRKIPNYKTAFNTVSALASSNKNTVKRGEREYTKLYDKYHEALPVTGILSGPTFHTTNRNLNSPNLSIKTIITNGTNLQQTTRKAENHLIKVVEDVMKIKKSFKIRIRCKAVYFRIYVDENGDEKREYQKGIISTKKPNIITKANYKETIKNEINILREVILGAYGDGTDIEKNGSGWNFEKIEEFITDIFEIKPVRGSSYIPTPEKYSNAKCGLINIRNEDQECFKWCMKYHQTEKNKHDDRISSLKKVDDKFNYEGINFPASYDDVEKFEHLNKVSIYIYSLEKNDEGDDIIITDKEGNNDYILNDVIYLLRISNDDKEHYIYIKHIDRLMNIHTQRTDTNKRYCPICRGKIDFKEYTTHISNCLKFAKDSTLLKLPNEGETMEFRNYKNMLERPYIVYADFECSLCKVEGEDDNKIAHHKPNSGCAYLVCNNDHTKNKKMIFKGENCVVDMIKELNRTANDIVKEMRENERMRMTDKDELNFKKAKCCFICNKKFTEQNYKVRDHDHRTGIYRGAAHSKCNINYYCNRFLPVVFHNLRGYDSHLIIQEAFTIYNSIEEYDPEAKEGEQYKKVNISIIPNSYEKFMSFSIGNLKFIDSLQFLPSSLEKLVENLYDTDDKYKNFNFIKKEYPDHYKLLCQKGFYPYEWVNSQDKLNYKGLPPKEEFYSNLKQENITDENYKHALNVYNKLECQTFYDYHLTYLSTDVLLLADVFENFRKTCLNYYNLDPANYLSAPALAWDAMLYKTGITLDLITDLKMHDLIERMKRGGLCYVGSKRHVKANNKYLENYNPEQDSNYIMYWDANNLYGWAMSQYLPYADLKFDNNITLDQILETEDDNEIGYIVELDLSFPEELHDKFKEFPPCPENITPNIDWFSDFQKEVGTISGTVKKGKYSGSNKLIPHLFEHKNYVIHYRNLKFIHDLGVKIDKIHNIITFKQKDWLKEYIDFNTNKRKEAKNDFEKDFFKLMNNAVFGKTMENVKNRIDLKLTLDPKYAIKYFSKFNFKDSRYFKGLFLIEMFRAEIQYNKPVYVGTSVLDLSKLCMMDFHYNTIHKNFENNYNLIYSDTDSLIYSIKHDDIYEWIKDNKIHFDLSDSIRTELKDNTNKKVIGKFKDELNSLIMTEITALNPKVYSINHQTFDELNLLKIKNKKTLKGVSRVVVKNEISNSDYIRVLETSEILRRQILSIQSTNQAIHTKQFNKIALTNFYDKGHMVDNTNNTPYGYKVKYIKV